MRKRERELQTVEEIALHQNIARMATYALALSLGAGFLLIHNSQSDGTSGAMAILEDCQRLLIST